MQIRVTQSQVSPSFSLFSPVAQLSREAFASYLSVVRAAGRFSAPEKGFIISKVGACAVADKLKELGFVIRVAKEVRDLFFAERMPAPRCAYSNCDDPRESEGRTLCAFHAEKVEREEDAREAYKAAMEEHNAQDATWNGDDMSEFKGDLTPQADHNEPAFGTYAYSARIMVACGMSGEEADRWKDEMKDNGW